MINQHVTFNFRDLSYPDPSLTIEQDINLGHPCQIRCLALLVFSFLSFPMKAFGRYKSAKVHI